LLRSASGVDHKRRGFVKANFVPEQLDIRLNNGTIGVTARCHFASRCSKCHYFKGVQMGLLNNDIVLITWRGACFGQQILLTHHYKILGDYNAATSIAQDLDNITQNIHPLGANDVTTPYLACLPPQYGLIEIRAQRIKATRSAYRAEGNAFPGTHASPATVANDAACVTLRTDLAGRSQVSNKHIGPIPDAVSAAGVLTPAYKVLLASLGSKLVTAFAPVGSGSVVTPVVYNRVLNTSDVLNNYIVGEQSRVQRRRTVGLGE